MQYKSMLRKIQRLEKQSGGSSDHNASAKEWRGFFEEIMPVGCHWDLEKEAKWAASHWGTMGEMMRGAMDQTPELPNINQPMLETPEEPPSQWDRKS